MSCTSRLLLGFVFCVAPLFAQVHHINGSSSALVPVNSNMTATFAGQPSQWHWWMVDISPGPVSVYGVEIALGLTPYLLDLGIAQLDSVGHRALTIGVVDDPALHGLSLYSCGLFLDPTAPSQFTASNGASMTFLDDGASAGGDAAAFSGEPITLDGSGNLDPATNALPVGASITWLVVDAGGAANPRFLNPNAVYPQFVADSPGTVLARCYVQGGGVAATDDVRIDVYNLNLNSPVDNGFATASVQIAGQLQGPSGSALSRDGQGIVLAADGTFNAGTIALTQRVTEFRFAVSAPSGAVVAKTVTVTKGVGQAWDAFQTPGTLLRMGGVTLDALETVLSQAFGSISLNPIVSAIPAIPIINTTFFSATIDPTGATHDPAVVVDIFPAANGIGVSVTWTNVVITSAVTGSLFFVPYTETATISATSVVVTAELQITSNASGALVANLVNRDATLNGFTFSVTGALGGLTQISLIQQAMRAAIELALETALDVIPLALNHVLGTIVLQAPLPGTPLTLGFPLENVVYDPAGLVIANRFRATTSAVAPTAPNITQIWGSTGSTPSFGNTTPVSALPFDHAIGISDGALNQILGTLTMSGYLDMPLSLTSLSITNAGGMAMLTPGAGFESFDPATPVTARIAPRAAPLIEFSATAGQHGTVRIPHLRVEVLAGAAGSEVPVLTCSLSITAGISITADPVTGVMTFNLSNASATVSLLENLAGYDASTAVGALNSIALLVAQQVLGPLSSIAFPTLGAAGLIPEVSVHPANPHLVCVYIDVP